MAEERNEEIERLVRDQIAADRVFNQQNNVAEVRNKLTLFDDVKSTVEKLKGRFDLRINSRLPMGTKINKFGMDPLAFHLHKNRQFIRKLTEPK